MIRKTAILVSLLLAGAGCATGPPIQLKSGAENVIVATSDPGDNYKMIGTVSGSDGSGCGPFGYKGSYERAATDLKNRTHDMGGDYAQINAMTEPHLEWDCFDNDYVIRATAYKRVRTQPSPTSIPESGEEKLTKELRELKKLLDDGILSKEEFEQQKARLLEKGFQP